jgi:hypothetical protein
LRSQVRCSQWSGHPQLQALVPAGSAVRADSGSLIWPLAYLAPKPSAPFVALTEALVAEFPKFPPFAGEFPTIIPHLTVAHGNAEEAHSVEAELVSKLA